MALGWNSYTVSSVDGGIGMPSLALSCSAIFHYSRKKKTDGGAVITSLSMGGFTYLYLKWRCAIFVWCITAWCIGGDVVPFGRCRAESLPENGDNWMLYLNGVHSTLSRRTTLFFHVPIFFWFGCFGAIPHMSLLDPPLLAIHLQKLFILLTLPASNLNVWLQN